MASLSMWHWIILLIFLAIYIVPLWRILNKAGFHGALAFLSLIPLVNIVLLWVFAFVKWPVERSSK